MGLPGVKVDVKNMTTLWRDIAKYPNVHIITEDLKKEYIQMFEFEKWIKQRAGWLELFGEEKGIDGILFIFSGHGTNKKSLDRDYVVTSDGNGWPLARIQEKFGDVSYLKDKTKIFYVDACRGNNAVEKSESDTDNPKGTASNTSKQYFNASSGFYTHFSTSDKFVSYENKDGGGGYLLSAVYALHRKRFESGKAVNMGTVGMKLNGLVNKAKKGMQTAEISNKLTVNAILCPANYKNASLKQKKKIDDDAKMDDAAIRDMVKKNKAKKIKLSVYAQYAISKHREYRPDRLLDGSKYTFYMSKWQVTTGDWITFKMHSPAFITKIKIRNRDYPSAIHSIALFIGSDESPKKMEPLCANIENIQQEWLEFQEFDIFHSLSLSEHYLWQNKDKFNLIKVKILKNYVDKSGTNSFHEFEVFGIE